LIRTSEFRQAATTAHPGPSKQCIAIQVWVRPEQNPPAYRPVDDSRTGQLRRHFVERKTFAGQEGLMATVNSSVRPPRQPFCYTQTGILLYPHFGRLDRRSSWNDERLDDGPTPTSTFPLTLKALRPASRIRATTLRARCVGSAHSLLPAGVLPLDRGERRRVLLGAAHRPDHHPVQRARFFGSRRR